MEPEKSKRKIRLISGCAPYVDDEVNQLLDEYMLMTLHYAAVGDHMEVTAYLILQVELRKMQLANPTQLASGRH
jgi:hypothetical protein